MFNIWLKNIVHMLKIDGRRTFRLGYAYDVLIANDRSWCKEEIRQMQRGKISWLSETVNVIAQG